MYTKEKFIFLFLNPIKRYYKRLKEGGVVHHLGDSHINPNVRIKFALTYDYPVILPSFLVQITGIREDRKSRRGVDLDEVIFILAIIVIAYMVYKEVVKRR
jgi:hypothetical protein